jgi:thiosulfate/3-mercaptopyruvate sulfurtransferase
MDALVSTEWLAGELGKPDLVLFDATKYLPNEPKDGAAEFRAAHIAGARYFDIDAIADPDTELPHMVPTPGRFGKLVGVLGVSNRSRVIFYDQKGLASAARGWWMMGLYGHDGTAVLDGGLPKWLREGRPVETGEPPAAKPTIFVPALRAGWLRGVGDLIANLDSGAEIVLDARAAGRFLGVVAELRSGVRSGHIPGARNLPYTELLAADQTMLAPAELRAKFATVGIDAGSKVVTSCGSGVTAAILTLGLHVAGLRRGALYDGSWTEWGGRSDTPVET